MQYNGSIHHVPGNGLKKNKKEVPVEVKPLWKTILSKLDIPVYACAVIWVIWLYAH